MRTGFYFKDISSTDYGISVKTERVVMPEVKQKYTDTEYSDGSMDFTAENPPERDLYSDRIFSITISFTAPSRRELISKASKISTWLTGVGVLRFNDMNTAWFGRFIKGGSGAPQAYGTAAELKLNFRCRPFAYLPGMTDEGLPDNIWFCDDVLIRDAGWEDLHRWTLSAGTETDVTVINIGSAPVAPVFTVTAQDSNIKKVVLSCGDRELTVSLSTAVSEIIIDCQECTVVSGSGKNLIPYTSGEFFELAAGENEFVMYTDKAAEISAGYEPQFFYDLDLHQTAYAN